MLSERLHKLGVLLHYQDDPDLSDTVFLDPQWVTRAMYTVLADQRLIDQGACFSQSWAVGTPARCCRARQSAARAQALLVCWVRAIPPTEGTRVDSEVVVAGGHSF